MSKSFVSILAITSIFCGCNAAEFSNTESSTKKRASANLSDKPASKSDDGNDDNDDNSDNSDGDIERDDDGADDGGKDDDGQDDIGADDSTNEDIKISDGKISTEPGSVEIEDGEKEINRKKKECAIYYYRNLDFGCGPSKIVTWRVSIQDTLPTFAQMKGGTVPTVIDGTYGDVRYGGCKNQAMPELHKHEELDYKLWTDGTPGSEDCEAYTETVSPLIVSFTEAKIKFTSPNKGPFINLSGLGEERFSWPAEADSHMFLVFDTNKDGLINSIHDLFGNNTLGPDKKTADNGFAALAKHDMNDDKVIDNKDAVFKDLKLWADKNGNGTADAGELFSMADKKVKSIKLEFTKKPTRIDFFGNESQSRHETVPPS